MVAFSNTDQSGRTKGLLLRCVLYSLCALGLMIADKRYDHLGQIRRWLSVVAYPMQIAVASPFEGYDWFRESVTTRDVLRADKARLEGDLRVAQFKLQRYEALEAESQRLRALRTNTADITDRFLIGDIMDLDLDAFRERVLVVFYWSIESPRSGGLTLAFVAGLALDVIRGVVLGQHALAIVLMAAWATHLRLRLRVFSLGSQMLTIFALLTGYQFVLFWIDGATGNPVTTFSRWLAPLIGALVWPLVSSLLGYFQER